MGRQNVRRPSSDVRPSSRRWARVYPAARPESANPKVHENLIRTVPGANLDSRREMRLRGAPRAQAVAPIRRRRTDESSGARYGRASVYHVTRTVAPADGD